VDSVDKAKAEVLKGCKLVVRKNFTVGTSGNISMRVEGENLFVITPTSMVYETLTADDLVVLDGEGNIAAGKWKPSTEALLHRKILAARPDINAIVHTHSLYATAYAACRNTRALPPVDIEAALYLGGDILVADFARPGSMALAENAVRALGNKAGVLLANHGAVGVGKTMEAAVTASEILEKTCHSVFLAALLGGIRELDPEYKAAAEKEYLRQHGILPLN